MSQQPRSKRDRYDDGPCVKWERAILSARIWAARRATAHLVTAGLSPMDALRTATYNPAKFLGLFDSLGTVEGRQCGKAVHA